MREKIHIKTFRMTEKENSAVLQKVALSGLKFSEYVLCACLGAEIIVIDDLKETRKLLQSLSNNINQMATLANMGKIKEVNLSEACRVLGSAREVFVGIDKKLRRR